MKRKYSINKLKIEVQKFGISGMEKTDRERATQAIAIKLGAVVSVTLSFVCFKSF